MFKQTASNSLKQKFNMGRTKLLGHRGARGEKIENTLQGFHHLQHLYQQNPNALTGIEFDVQLSKDGRLIVFHDDSFLRIYNHQTRVDQTNLSHLSQISNMTNRYGKHPLLTLEDMPALLDGYKHIELEIKVHNRSNYNLLVNALNECLQKPDFEALPITLTTFDTQLHYYLNKHSFLSKFNRGLLIEPIVANQFNKQFTTQDKNDLEKSNTTHFYNDLKLSTSKSLFKTPELALQLGCNSVGLYYPLCNKALIYRCHLYNLSTTAWTVNDINDAHALIENGVDYIITDHPTMMLTN